jgi:Glycosyl transferase family 2
MSVWGVSMMRDEEDVAAYVVRHMFDEGLAGIIVADNLSTDGTRAALESIADPRLTVVDDPVFEYHQSDLIMSLAARAEEQGASWIVPFDADEWWYSPWGKIGALLPDVKADVCEAEAYAVSPQRTDDPSDANPFTRLCRTSPNHGDDKVAFRTGRGLTIALGNHYVTPPPKTTQTGLVKIKHYPHRSLEQMTRKYRQGAAAVNASDYPYIIGAHWRRRGSLTDDELAHWWERILDGDPRTLEQFRG